MTAATCPRHPRHPVVDCPQCEELVAQRESAAIADEPHEADREAARYERWLNECLEGGA